MSEASPSVRVNTSWNSENGGRYLGIAVTAGNLVGEENRGFRLIMQGFEGERLVIAVMATAQMRLMWEEARRYGHERHAFGRSLLGFQVWRHRLADVRTRIEAAEALTYRAIAMHTEGQEANAEISMAKLFASEAAASICDKAARVAASYGFAMEYPFSTLSS